MISAGQGVEGMHPMYAPATNAALAANSGRAITPPTPALPPTSPMCANTYIKHKSSSRYTPAEMAVKR
jgi:hypothetical protein